MSTTNNLNDKKDTNLDISDYSFLENEESLSLAENEENVIQNHFDNAFEKSDDIIKDYILDDKFKTDIEKIILIDKELLRDIKNTNVLERDLFQEKFRTIIENTISAILVGLIKRQNAQALLKESLSSIGAKVPDEKLESLIKNINKYILRDLQEKLELKNLEKKKIKTLEVQSQNINLEKTNKKEKEEEIKKELRKILMDKTNKNSSLLKYSERDFSEKNEDFRKKDWNRDSLLEQINVDDEEKTKKEKHLSEKDINQRMLEITQKEKERLETSIKNDEIDTVPKEKEEAEVVLKMDTIDKNINKEEKIPGEESEEYYLKHINEEKEEDLSKIFAQKLKEDLENKLHTKYNEEEILKDREEIEKLKNTDPYREDYE